MLALDVAPFLVCVCVCERERAGEREREREKERAGERERYICAITIRLAVQKMQDGLTLSALHKLALTVPTLFGCL